MSTPTSLARTPEPPYYAVIFTSQRAVDDGRAYGAMAQRMVDLGSRYDGFAIVDKALTVLGDPLPTYDKLRYNSFDALQDQVSYLKTYVGPSFFGMGDVSWSSIRGAIQATR